MPGAACPQYIFNDFQCFFNDLCDSEQGYSYANISKQAGVILCDSKQGYSYSNTCTQPGVILCDSKAGLLLCKYIEASRGDPVWL